MQQELERELATLEIELTDIGALVPGGHEARAERRDELDIDSEDRNILADKFEETSTDASIARELTIRYESIKHALARIAEGTYGMCTTCGKPISEERLEANPAADTCISCAK